MSEWDDYNKAYSNNMNQRYSNFIDQHREFSENIRDYVRYNIDKDKNGVPNIKNDKDFKEIMDKFEFMTDELGHQSHDYWDFVYGRENEKVKTTLYEYNKDRNQEKYEESIRELYVEKSEEWICAGASSSAKIMFDSFVGHIESPEFTKDEYGKPLINNIFMEYEEFCENIFPEMQKNMELQNTKKEILESINEIGAKVDKTLKEETLLL